ncbi:MAG: AAA family ATPase [bacterium]|nr:AAA family ATPase [bacterium]
MEFINRFFKEPEGSFFLFGPRGTGKSTWVKHRFKEAMCIDLLSPEEFRIYSARPERLEERVRACADNQVFIIDEVQKVPELLSVVHRLIEEKRGWKFILTGSSARKLKRSGVDLLAGRVLLSTIHPFIAAEIGKKFNLEHALNYGLLPIVLASSNPFHVLQTYVSLYIREEVQMEGLVRNIGNFSRFLEAISFSHAGVLNLSQVGRECQVERKVVEGYVGILEDLLLSFRVPVFTKRAKRAVAVQPKFYFFDSGVYRALRPTGPLDRSEEIHGLAVEGLLAQHLQAWIAYSGNCYKLYYWRTRSQVEVDFVVYGPNGFWAIEVKNKARIDKKDLYGLRSFYEDYPESRPLLLYRGKERLKIADILCLPCEEFLCQLQPEKALDEGL